MSCLSKVKSVTYNLNNLSLLGKAAWEFFCTSVIGQINHCQPASPWYGARKLTTWFPLSYRELTKFIDCMKQDGNQVELLIFCRRVALFFTLPFSLPHFCFFNNMLCSYQGEAGLSPQLLPLYCKHQIMEVRPPTTYKSQFWKTWVPTIFMYEKN